MSKILIVMNTQARRYALPVPKSQKGKGETKLGITLNPGANEVDEDTLQEILDDPRPHGAGAEVRGYFDRGELRFQEDRDLRPANKASAKEAIAMVDTLGVKDMDELIRISLNDTRPTVQKAVERRLAQLAPKTEGEGE